jgi:hypothetical protein
VSGMTPTCAGVMVLTGVNVEEAAALRASFGAGMTWAVGGGVIIATGTGFREYVGPAYFVSFTHLETK